MINDKNISEIKENIVLDIANANDSQILEAVRVKYLGRSGIITLALRQIGELPVEKRAEAGKLLNEVKEIFSQRMSVKLSELKLKETSRNIEKEKVDVSLPGRIPAVGRAHVLTLMMNEIKDIFKSLGFKVEYGPEIETDYYNFEALNHPKDHPARDMHDTFYVVPDELVLRTHTSPVQIRTMEKQKPPVPIRMIALGKCYRSDPLDASHSPVFHQVEGLMVDKNITFSHLKGIMEIFFKQLFGDYIKVKLTPSYFPFTEPSAEVSVVCASCKGSGCSVCKKTGWLELFGAGMVDPNVFKAVKYDPEKWTGFAFGGGIERLAMVKYKINDIRLFYENDLRFLEQF